MNLAFFLNELNYRGVANSTFKYAYYNKKILKNSSYIFYKKNNKNNKHKVLKRFKNYFKTTAVNNFLEIDNFKKKFKLDYVYVQKSGKKDNQISYKIKTLVHSVYPQFLSERHGYKYVYISEWLSQKFGNKKIECVPLILELKKNSKTLNNKLGIKKNNIVFGCHGGESSFDLKFVQDTILDIIKKRKDIYFIFLNIKKFVQHNRIIFLKGTSNETYKRIFLNTCDAMIYGRSLGESFGLSCGEFSILKKKIILYKFSRHRNHISSLSKDGFIEYSSRNSLFNILNKFNKNNNYKIRSNDSNFKNSEPKQAIKTFDRIFLKNKKNIHSKITIFDFFLNYLSHILILYYYLRHKLYIHYYNFFESKLLNK